MRTLGRMREAIRKFKKQSNGGKEGVQMKPQNSIYFLLLVFLLYGCGGVSETGTDNNDTDNSGVDISTVSSRLGNTASALVPQMSASDISSSVSPGLHALTNGTSDDWDTYLSSTNSWVITDVFGDPDEEPKVVTKVQVLLNQFENTIEGIFSEDHEVSCAEGSELSEGDLIEIPFYGEIANGTSDDRYFDCQRDDGDEAGLDNELTIYGVDSDGVVRVVNMSVNELYENTDDVDTRGTNTLMRQVVYATYAESEGEEGANTYLDLRYAQSTLYEGADGEFNTDDDVVFRSRSRITGSAVLDDEGEPTGGTGDFKVTKHDIADYDITTKTAGRGSYGEGEYSLFKIDSDASSLEGMARTFCLQMPEDGVDIPLHAEAENCVDLEEAHAWGDSVFPFTLSPEVEEVFDDKAFFEGDDDDLIASDGSNFTMPTYE